MLLSTMTYDQIYHEIVKDFRDMKAYYDVQIKAVVSKSALRAKRYPLITQHSYTHPQSKNKYFYISIVKKRSLRDNPEVTVYCEYEGKYGKEILTIAPSKDRLTFQPVLLICIFEAHFFKRYFERFLVDITEERDKIKTFLIRNAGSYEIGSSSVSVNELLKDDSEYLDSAWLNLDGLCLGKIYNENRNIIIYKTFVSLSELHPKQLERVLHDYITMLAMRGYTDNPHCEKSIKEIHTNAVRKFRDIPQGDNQMAENERFQMYLQEYNNACDNLRKFVIMPIINTKKSH